MKLLLYGNGGSGNHGCEAIVRGTIALFSEAENSFILYSESPEQDREYGLESLAAIQNAKKEIKHDLAFFKAFMKLKCSHDYAAMDALSYIQAIQRSSQIADLALSVGGDNYCYRGTGVYAELNKAYHKAGMKTVLWGCSVEPAVTEIAEVKRDLAGYDGIVARESISYEALKKVNPNTVLAPDPAFFMDAKACTLDSRFDSGNVIGVNVSPMIISNEAVQGITLENYLEMVRFILDNTDCDIAFIPHVVWKQNDDREALNKLLEHFSGNDRIFLVQDMTAPELKYCISKCRLFVGARTHATIAAYSSCVPTLVLGYSVKARGIAKDLFGQHEHYVLDVQSLKEAGELKQAFQWIMERESDIRSHLEQVLPAYKERASSALKLIDTMAGA